jgi:aryl-alcohol dehydrogenase-like predicted oxidoreductase
MTFGSDPRFPSVAKVDLDSAKEMVERALDAGVNFFDTADGYSGDLVEAGGRDEGKLTIAH